jgi:serine/threonine protein kinase
MDKINRYNIKYKIGRGSFSTVFLAIHIETNTQVALKQIDITNQTESELRRLKEEIRLWSELKHKNIVEIFDHFETQDKNEKLYYIVLEYCDNGDFEIYLQKNRLKENQVYYYMNQLRVGLEYLYGKKIYHRDLKPSNLLLSNHNQCLKISDFGFAKEIFIENNLFKTICGTPMYMAPEIYFHENGYSIKSDLWSIGLIIYQCIYGCLPYSNAKNQRELFYMIQHKPIVFPKNIHISIQLRDLLHCLLQKDPFMRLSWIEFLNHSWFNKTLDHKKSINDYMDHIIKITKLNDDKTTENSKNENSIHENSKNENSKNENSIHENSKNENSKNENSKNENSKNENSKNENKIKQASIQPNSLNNTDIIHIQSKTDIHRFNHAISCSPNYFQDNMIIDDYDPIQVTEKKILTQSEKCSNKTVINTKNLSLPTCKSCQTTIGHPIEQEFTILANNEDPNNTIFNTIFSILHSVSKII